MNLLKTICSALFYSMILLACNDQATSENDSQSAPVQTPPSAASPEIDAATMAGELHRQIQTLASDEFEGRAPATPGEEKTIKFLREEFAALDVGPGNGDSYFQEVAVTEITTNSDTEMTLSGANYQTTLRYGEKMMVATQQQVDNINVINSDLVFAGYGIAAPERDWNDYANLDVSGKTVVILVNDPGFTTQDEDLFNGNTMTYYGRWTYKYEEAARQGAAAALIVHETDAAGYPWEVVTGSWSGPQIGLQSANLNADKLKIEGWLTLDAAQELFAAAGLDYEEQKQAAAQPGFSAMPLSDLTMSVGISNQVRNSTSQNVIAKITGSERPQETIIYTAHWDHLGVNPELEGDTIYNGAVDNATGAAALLALAKLFSEQEPPPKRSIIFLAVTAEESGLLGSKWYAEHPVYPLAKTVANINMDAMNVNGPMADIVVVGPNSSELEHYLEEFASSQGRYLAPEPNPERGYYYRSDHFNFAKAGVPSLYAESGEDSLARGRDWGAQQSLDYTNFRYHTPLDEYNPDWDLSGMVQDILLYYQIGQKLSQESSFPTWFEGNEFKATRDQSRTEQ